MKKILVAFFSAYDDTRDVAGKIAMTAEADIKEILPQIPYNQDDIDWKNPQSRVARELDNAFSRPKLAETIENIEQYDIIFLGFPIWWYTCPAIIYSFVEAHNLSNAIIVPFATSDGSKSGKIHRACAELRRNHPRYKWNEGRLLNNPTDKLINDWVHQNS